MLHGDMFRLLCGALDQDFVGLTVAARHARRAGRISHQTSKKLERLDAAFAYTRHISVPKARAFLKQVSGELVSDMRRTAGTVTSDVELIDAGSVGCTVDTSSATSCANGTDFGNFTGANSGIFADSGADSGIGAVVSPLLFDLYDSSDDSRPLIGVPAGGRHAGKDDLDDGTPRLSSSGTRRRSTACLKPQ